MWFIVSSYVLVFGGMLLLTLWSVYTYQRAKKRFMQLKNHVETRDHDIP